MRGRVVVWGQRRPHGQNPIVGWAAGINVDPGCIRNGNGEVIEACDCEVKGKRK